MAAEFTIKHLAPRDLLAHPFNWRRHPERQKEALAASLASHGWLAAPIWNKRTGHLLDGHARVEHAKNVGAESIPVRVIDVDEEQEKRILASFDRIGELRERDDVALTALLKDLAKTDEGLPAGWDAQDLGDLLLKLAPAPPLEHAGGEDALDEGGFLNGFMGEAERETEPGMPNSEYVKVSFAFLPEERDRLFDVLNAVKAERQLDTHGEALLAIIEERES